MLCVVRQREEKSFYLPDIFVFINPDQMDFQRNGQTVYKTVSFVGYVGVISGVKPVRLFCKFNMLMFVNQFSLLLSLNPVTVKIFFLPTQIS